MSTALTKRKSEAIYATLGANERAVVDNVRISWLRRIVIRLVGIKLQLQFTGWLQYLMPAPIMLGLFVLSGLIYLVSPWFAFYVAMLPTALLLIILFDIVTTRFGIRFPESIPTGVSESNVFELIRQRKSCRSYQIRSLTSEHEEALLASVNKHMSGPHFSKANIRLEWIHQPITVWPVVNARHFLVAIAPAEYDRKAVMDVGRTLQKVVIDLTRRKIATCWIGPGADHNSVEHALGERFDRQKDAIICVCAVGYRSWYTPLFIRVFNTKTHNRLPLASLFFANHEMTEPLNVSDGPFAEYEPCCVSSQWSPSSYNGQTTRCVGIQSGPSETSTKAERFDFYAVTASRYYAAVATGIWCANWEMSCDALNLKGEFKLLSQEERGVPVHADTKTPPFYEISWLCN